MRSDTAVNDSESQRGTYEELIGYRIVLHFASINNNNSCGFSKLKITEHNQSERQNILAKKREKGR